MDPLVGDRNCADRSGGPLVLAVDQGTSATKAVLVDAAGAMVGRASVPVRQSHPGPGRAVQDPQDLWRSVDAVIGRLLAAPDAARVTCVGLSTQRESTILWERSTGEPLDVVLGWQDTRGSALCQELRAAGVAPEVCRRSGLPLDPMFSASKASWLLDKHDPSRTRSARGELCLGTVDSWLLWRLGAGHVIEAGNASRTQLLGIEQLAWDPWLLQQFRVPIECLPHIVGSAGDLGGAVSMPGCSARVPVAATLGDSHAALFAHGAWRAGLVKATYGTGSSVMGIVSDPNRVPDGLARTVAWHVGLSASLAFEGNIRASGATLVWLASIIGGDPADVAKIAATDSGGVSLVPAFSGLGAPWWDEQAQGTITGIGAGTTKEHLARAALEAIAYQVEDVVRASETESAPVDEILADGGPSANPTLMQLQADLSGRPVLASEVSELSALGAAHLAGIAFGLWSSDTVAGFARPRRRFTPMTTATERARGTERWLHAVRLARTVAQERQDND